MALMHRTPVRPPRLEAGATVGIVTPSSPPPPGLLDGHVAYWEERGFRVRLGSHLDAIVGGYLAGTPQERAGDVNRFLADPEVRLIVPAMGGKGCSQILPLIDYDLLTADPKLVIGGSDTSILVLALHAVTKVVTLHGPTGMDLGRGVPPLTEHVLHSALSEPAPLGMLPVYGPRETINGGTATGPLLGGHLGTIRALVGSRFEPDWTGSLLFIEEIDTEFHDLDASLQHLRLAGILERAAGLLVGRCVNVDERYWPTDDNIGTVLRRALDGVEIPILYGVELGHTRDKVTLPVGCEAHLDADRGAVTVLESATR